MSHQVTATDEITVVERAALAPGAVVAGKYVVSRFVGAGGMAQVFEALNRDIDERVALKLMHPAFRSDAGFTAKFRMEAKSAARIKSEFVARVFDVVSTDDGDPVIVMEFLDGLDLRSWVDTHGLPSVETAVGWMIEACAGLAVAHANGIVHRDVKPENLFIAHEIGGREQLKLLDFGISRAALAYNPQKAGSGQHGALRLNGTPTYMAPEQVTSTRAADPRMDVWSIGVLLFELLAGEPPFQGATPEETCLAILQNRKPDLRKLRADLPEQLVQAIELCLAPTPEGRLPSVADVAVALHPFARPNDVSSVDRTVTLMRSAGLTSATVPPDRRSLSAAVTPLPPGPVSSPSALAPASIPAAPVASSAPPTSAPVVSSAPPLSAPLAVASAPPVHAANTSRKLYGALAVLLLAAGALAFFLGRPSATVGAPPSSVVSSSPTRFTAEIASVPSGATITVDGVSHGIAPRRIAFTSGKHQVTVELPGYVTATRTLDVDEATDGTIVSVELLSATAATAAPVRDLPTATPSVSSKSRSLSRSHGAEPKPVATPATSTGPNPKPTVQLLPDGTSNVKVIE